MIVSDDNQERSITETLPVLTPVERSKLLSQLKADYEVFLSSAPFKDDSIDRKSIIDSFESDKTRRLENGENETDIDQDMRDRLADQTKLNGREIAHRLAWEAARLDGGTKPYKTEREREIFSLGDDDFSKIYKYVDPQSPEATHPNEAKRRAGRQAALYDIKALDIVHQRIVNGTPIDDYKEAVFIAGRDKYSHADTYQRLFQDAASHAYLPQGAEQPSVADKVLTTKETQSLREKLDHIEEDLKYWEAYQRFNHLKKQVDLIHTLHVPGQPESRLEKNFGYQVEIEGKDPVPNWMRLIQEDIDNGSPEMRKYHFDKDEKGKPIDYHKESEIMQKTWKSFSDKNNHVGMLNMPSNLAMRDALHKYATGHSPVSRQEAGVFPAQVTPLAVHSQASRPV